MLHMFSLTEKENIHKNNTWKVDIEDLIIL